MTNISNPVKKFIERWIPRLEPAELQAVQQAINTSQGAKEFQEQTTKIVRNIVETERERSTKALNTLKRDMEAFHKDIYMTLFMLMDVMRIQQQIYSIVLPRTTHIAEKQKLLNAGGGKESELSAAYTRFETASQRIGLDPQADYPDFHQQIIQTRAHTQKFLAVKLLRTEEEQKSAHGNSDLAKAKQAIRELRRLAALTSDYQELQQAIESIGMGGRRVDEVLSRIRLALVNERNEKPSLLPSQWLYKARATLASSGDNEAVSRIDKENNKGNGAAGRFAREQLRQYDAATERMEGEK